MATNRLQFFKKHGIPASQSLSLMEISGLSKVPIAALNKIYARGIGAYRTQPTSVRAKGTFKKGQPLSVVPLSGRLSPQQWAMARVYAFVNKSKGTYYGADADIRREFGV
jgi:hypothetical protein